jgi:uncharacterized membrane protein
VTAPAPFPDRPAAAAPPGGSTDAAPPAVPAPAADQTAPRRKDRVPVIDWLRGIAVITMIVAHSFDSWTSPAVRTGVAWDVVRHVSGLPSRLFLFLVGVSSAVVLEKELARGTRPAEMRRRTVRRGLGLLGMALLFRLQEHVLSAGWGGWRSLFRVDILNCIGASILVIAVVGVPRAGKPRLWLPLATAAIFVALGPLVGPAVFPRFVPRVLSSYIGGQRPMAWFPLFPWGAWALCGLAVGHIWLRESRAPDAGRRCFVITGVVGTISLGTVLTVRAIDPHVIRYPSDVVAQMGPGSFFFRLGAIGILALVGWLATRWLNRIRPGRFSVLNQLGQTSLFVYWVHVELCYGFESKPIHKRLSLPAATFAFALLTAAMVALSIWKTRHGAAVTAALKEKLRKLRPR